MEFEATVTKKEVIKYTCTVRVSGADFAGGQNNLLKLLQTNTLVWKRVDCDLSDMTIPLITSFEPVIEEN